MEEINIKSQFYRDAFKLSPVWLNFTQKVKRISEADRTVEFELVVNDPRWIRREIDGEDVFYDQVDGGIFPIRAMLKAFYDAKEKFGGGVPTTLREAPNHVLGASTVSGIEERIRQGLPEQAYLSCHGIFTHRLQVIAYLLEKGQTVKKEEWLLFKKQNWKASELIRKCSPLFSQDFIKKIKKYNTSRNKITHEMGNGMVDSRLLNENLKEGVEILNLIEKYFLEYLNQ